MGLNEQIILDVAELTADTDDFGISILLTAPTLETATLNGYATKHHLKLDSASGQVVNSKNASVVVAELNVLAANPLYPIRGTNPSLPNYQEVSFIGHLVEVSDSSGVTKKYTCSENFADEACGLITLVLEDYND